MTIAKYLATINTPSLFLVFITRGAGTTPRLPTNDGKRGHPSSVRFRIGYGGAEKRRVRENFGYLCTLKWGPRGKSRFLTIGRSGSCP